MKQLERPAPAARTGTKARSDRDERYDALRRRRVTAQRTRRRVISRKRRAVRFFLMVMAFFSFSGMTGVGVVWAAYNNYLSQLPDAATLAASEPPMDTKVYAADGTLIHIFHDQDSRHEHVALGNISRYVRLATLDTEDRHFYDESSWDLPRLTHVGFDYVTHGSTQQGASTITEQLAKISFLPSEKSLDRKAKQLILGNEIDASFTKDQILEMYLNRIAYGNFAVGIETAADLYFGKTSDKLDLAESSLLAGLPQSPTYYNPVVNNVATVVQPNIDPTKNTPAKVRQKVVLDAMVSQGDITRAQADAAFAQKLIVHPWTDWEVSVAPDFVGYLQSYLTDKFGDAFVRPGGWKVYTTLDLGKQQIAEKQLHDGIVAIRSKNARDGALVSMDPTNGSVLAMVGTWDYNDKGTGKLNMALRMRQPGSTIKLFTYSAALASRMYSMTTPILDGPVTLRPPGSGSHSYSPQNYDLRYHGYCQLKACLGNSFNVPAVKTEVAVGIPFISDLEQAMGLTAMSFCATSGGQERCNRPGPYDYAATLGSLTFGVTPLDLASGAATIANMGVHHDPTPVTKILDALSGKTLWSNNPAATARQVLPAGVAYIMSQITSNDHNRIIEFGANGDLTLGARRVSAKTGTTQFFTDNWTVGWTPQLVTAVWVGNPTPSCLRTEDHAAMLSAMQHKYPLYGGERIDDPFSPQDLAYYGIHTPINDHCGHLVGSTGITGAAPIWHRYMNFALAADKPIWYTKPADVIQKGTGDDADFFLPGTTNGAPTDIYGTGCWYYAPKANPTSTCRYLGPTILPGYPIT